MLLKWTDLLEEINELFIKITRDKIFKNEKEDFLSHVQICLRLNRPEDWNYILASEDILEDSNTAISHFLKFGTSGPTKYDDLGEKYLRMYRNKEIEYAEFARLDVAAWKDAPVEMLNRAIQEIG